jgi:hypothetical protein
MMKKPSSSVMSARSHGLRPCTVVWLVLVGLTLAVLAVGQAGLGGPWVVGMVLLTTLLKTQLVADYFMGLRRSAMRWLFIVSSYLLLVTGLIGLAYWLSLD